jgi:phosphoserine aminotransferase
VLFLQGGGRLQFSMIPMNLLNQSQPTADYILTGSWGKLALKEARKHGEMGVAWDGADSKYTRTPGNDQLDLTANSAYTYYVCNETIEGVQFPGEPAVGASPLVCDASSDFMHKPLDISKYGLVYACAQKNIGPAGVTVVIVRNDLLERSSEELPIYLNYKIQAEQGSLMNTAPTFAIYVVRLVTDWLINEIGGLDKMQEINKSKAQLLYDVIDQHSDFYEGHADPSARSLMNVTWRLPNDELTSKVLAEAADHDMTALAGHRSVGGIRASIYNAMPVAGVEALRDFMLDFCSKNA